MSVIVMTSRDDDLREMSPSIYAVSTLCVGTPCVGTLCVGNTMPALGPTRSFSVSQDVSKSPALGTIEYIPGRPVCLFR